jgi:hypothetical protein
MESRTQPSRTEVVVKTVKFDSPKVEKSMFSVPYLHRIR